MCGACCSQLCNVAFAIGIQTLEDANGVGDAFAAIPFGGFVTCSITNCMDDPSECCPQHEYAGDLKSSSAEMFQGPRSCHEINQGLSGGSPGRPGFLWDTFILTEKCGCMNAIYALPS
jgi:hypothetical protein